MIEENLKGEIACFYFSPEYIALSKIENRRKFLPKVSWWRRIINRLRRK